MKKEKIGFAALRMQPGTNGHFRLIFKMMMDNDIVILGLGSSQVEGTMANPLSTKIKIEIIRKVLGKNSKDKVKIIPLHDIGATQREQWVSYCMKEIKSKNLPTPTSYYAGSVTDLDWFNGAVNDDGDEIELINLDRHQTDMLSGTLVRQSISTGTDEWKEHVPKCVIDIIEDNYPEDLLLEYHRKINLSKTNI